jgi:hypothetical protein
MQDGRIAETGSHDDLMARAGKYANMLSFDQSHQNGDSCDDATADREARSGATSPLERQTSKKSHKKESEDLLQKFTNEEADVKEAGFKVLVKYFKVRPMRTITCV